MYNLYLYIIERPEYLKKNHRKQIQTLVSLNGLFNAMNVAKIPLMVGYITKKDYQDSQCFNFMFI